MSDGRRIRIIFLNDSQLEIPVQPRLSVIELRDIVASHINIQDRQYFGLAYKDSSGFLYWLNTEKRVLDHEVCSSKSQGVLYFLIKFYEESHALISDINIFEQLFFQAKRQLSTGELECSPKDLFHLTGLILQIVNGDYEDDKTALADIKKLNPFPTRIFEFHPSVEYCENQVLEYYRSNVGIEKGEALMDFLSAVETLPCYGYHYYEVLDDKKMPLYLAFNCAGVHIFDRTNKEQPRKTYCWHQTNELSSSRQKITLEVSEPRRRSASVSRRTIANMSTNCSYRTYHYTATNSGHSKSIVAMANDQRKFFTKRKLENQNSRPARHDVAYTLTHRSHSFSRTPTFNCSRAESQRKQSASSSDLMQKVSEEGNDRENVQNFMSMTQEEIQSKRTELIQKQGMLFEQLVVKQSELKLLLQEEFSITGIMPEEYRLVSEDKDREVKQTGYMLSPNLMRRMTQTGDNEVLGHSLSHLEMELSLLKQIYAVNKDKARKTRKKEYRLACKKDLIKLKNMQSEIDRLRCHPGLRQRPSLPGWLGSRISDLSLSLPGSSDTGSVLNSVGAVGTDDSTGDSISLNSTSSIDTGSSDRRVNSTRSIPEDILESPLKISADFLTKSHLDQCPMSSLEATHSSTPQSYLKAGCYMGACQNAANAARFRYREMMIFSDVSPLFTNSPPNSSSEQKDRGTAAAATMVNKECEEAATFLTTPTPVAVVSPGNVKQLSSFNDSGFLSIVNRNDWSPPSPRRQSEGTLTRAPIVSNEELTSDEQCLSLDSQRHSLSEQDIYSLQDNNNNKNHSVRSCAEIFTFDTCTSRHQCSVNAQSDSTNRRRKYGRPFGPCESVLLSK